MSFSPGEFLANVDDPQDRRHHKGHNDEQDHGTGGGGGILQYGDLIRQRQNDRGALTAAHDLHHEEISHHQRQYEDGAERNPGFRQRDDDFPYHAPGAGAAVNRRFDERTINARHGVEDGHDHEQCEQVHIGD